MVIVWQSKTFCLKLPRLIPLNLSHSTSASVVNTAPVAGVAYFSIQKCDKWWRLNFFLPQQYAVQNMPASTILHFGHATAGANSTFSVWWVEIFKSDLRHLGMTWCESIWNLCNWLEYHAQLKSVPFLTTRYSRPIFYYCLYNCIPVGIMFW